MASIFVCGDVVNHHRADGRICSREMARIIFEADYSIANFEAPVESGGQSQHKSGKHLQQRPETIAGMSEQGFNLLLVANNHIMDYGRAGLIETLRLAHERGLDTLGAGLNPIDAYEPLIRVIGGWRVGMINACEAQFGLIDGFARTETAGYAWINDYRIDRAVLQLRQECDVVLVFAHAGLEHYPIPQREWRSRYRHLCDLGADVVLGSHPHVPQGYEVHSNSLIFYSLGNFFFDAFTYPNKEDRSYSVILELSADRPLPFKTILHHMRAGTVHLATNEGKIAIDQLCKLLEEGYEERHDAMSLQTYEWIRRSLRFTLLPTPFDGGVKTMLRRLASMVFDRRARIDKDILQLHLLRNEAYYFAAKHALEIMVRRKHRVRD